MVLASWRHGLEPFWGRRVWFALPVARRRRSVSGMSLRFEPDVGCAAWFAGQRDVDCDGPAGFEACVRIAHPDGVEGHLAPEMLARLIEVLAGFTNTTAQCWFGLWEGFGDIWGWPSVALFTISADASAGDPPHASPAFPPEVLNGPRLDLGRLQYLVFSGPLAQAGDWGAPDYPPGWDRRTINSPNLMWPADRAWFVATEIDTAWTVVAGTHSLAATLREDPLLRAT